MSNEVATSGSSVPALADTPSVHLDSEDIALPRLYLGQYMSEHVQENRVPAGSIFTALGQDDADPVVVWEQGDEPGVIVRPLSLSKGKSISEGGELVLFDYDDPEAPADAWVTYNYVVALPEVDQDMPFKWLLTRTGKPTAQKINTVIAKNQATTPPWGLAFSVKAVARENQKGKFFVPSVTPIEADKAHDEVVQELASYVSAPAQQSGGVTEEPNI